MTSHQDSLRRKLRQRYDQKKILILGFGREGKTSYHFLRRLLPEQHFWLMDEAAIDPQDMVFWQAEKGGFDQNVSFLTGEQYLKNLVDYDLIFKTPGLPGYRLGGVAAEKITSQTNEFAAQVGGRVIGVTGTKGKSTTSSLIYAGLKALGQDVLLVGNIGKPALELLLEDVPGRLYVYEMSSHQTQFLRYPLRVGVVLNLFEEHLDNYTDYEEYIQAKLNIGRYGNAESLFLYGCDNDKLKSYAELWQNHRHQAFGKWENNSLHDGGIFLKGDQIVRWTAPGGSENEDLIKAIDQRTESVNSSAASEPMEKFKQPVPVQAGATGETGRQSAAAGDNQNNSPIQALNQQSESACLAEKREQPAPGQEMVLGRADFPRKLLGQHNLINALVTLAVAEELLGLTPARLERLFQAIGEFAGLEHRLEYVGRFAGIDFYDDSISTIPAAALAAIGSIPGIQTLILGGYDRGIGYEDFVQELNRRPDLKLICLPTTGHKLLAGLKHQEKYRAADMAEAVDIAFAVTAAGRACALSPAAASYTFYRNFEERGRDFQEKVKNHGGKE